MARYARRSGCPARTGGYLLMIVSVGTIISSLVSGKVIKRFGTGMVTFVSVFMTAMALLGFSFAPSILWLVLCAIPLGLGAGAVDTALNNYVALNYKAHHISWLHSFWGVGATLGPIIMAQYIAEQQDWRSGYLSISALQFTLVIILLLSLPVWKKAAEKGHVTVQQSLEDIPVQRVEQPAKPIKPLQIKGVKLAMLSFLFYCAVEVSVGLWGSSFLVEVKDLSASAAAQWVSLYWGGLTIGRFITGFITFRINNRLLIRSGQILALIGAFLLVLPFPSIISLIGFIIIGLGLAPIFPCMLHETPARFGKTHSQTIIGYQMATAYTGTTLMPFFLGLMASYTTVAIFPFLIVVYLAIMLFTSEKLNGLLRKRTQIGVESVTCANPK